MAVKAVLFLLAGFVCVSPAWAQDHGWPARYIAACTGIADPDGFDIPEAYQKKVCQCVFSQIDGNPLWGGVAEDDLATGLNILESRRQADVPLRKERPHQAFTAEFANADFGRWIGTFALNGVVPATKDARIVSCLNELAEAERPPPATKSSP